jgi:hypothetical protein
MIEPKKRYVFEVPDTKISYVIQITYDSGLLRQLELTGLYRNGRDVSVSNLNDNEKSLFFAHYANKVNKAPLIL